VQTGEQMTVTGEAGGAVDSNAAVYCRKAATDNIHALQLRDTTIVVNKDVTCEKDTTLLTDSMNVAPIGTVADYRSKSARRAFLFVKAGNYLTTYAVRFVMVKEDDTFDPANTTVANRLASVAVIRTHDGSFGNLKNGGPNHEPPYTPLVQEAGYQIANINVDIIAFQIYALGARSGSSTSHAGGIDAVYSGITGFGPETFIKTYTYATAPTERPPQASGVMCLELRDDYDTDDTEFRKGIELEVHDTGTGRQGALTTFKDVVSSISDLPLVCLDSHVVKVTGDASAGEDDYYVKFVADDVIGTPREDTLYQGHWEETTASMTEYTIEQTTMPHKIVRVVDTSEPSGFRFEIVAIDWDDKLVGDADTNPDPSFIGKTIDSAFFWKNRLGFLSAGSILFSEAGNFFNFFRTTTLTVPDSDPIDVEVGTLRGEDPIWAIPQGDSLIVFSPYDQFVVVGEPLLSPKTIAIARVAHFESYRKLQPLTTGGSIFFAHKSTGASFSEIKELRRIGDSERYDDFPNTAQVPRYIDGEVDVMSTNPSNGVLVCKTSKASKQHVLYVYRWFDSGNERVLSSWARFRLGAGTEMSTSGQYDCEVIGFQFFDNELFLFVIRDTDADAIPTLPGNQRELCLEKIVFGDQYTDEFPLHDSDPTDHGSAQSQYLTLLDRRITEQDCTIDYDYSTREVTIQLPYTLAGDTGQSDGVARMKVVSRIAANDGGTSPGYPAGTGATPTAEGWEFPISGYANVDISGRNVSVIKIADNNQAIWLALGSPSGTPQSTDERGLRLFIGQTYDMDYVFTRFDLQDINDEQIRGILQTGRWQLIRGTISYEDTGYVEVEVAPAAKNDGTVVADRDTHTYQASPFAAGLLEFKLGQVNVRSGKLSFPLLSRPENVKVSIKNSSPFPSNVRSIEVEGRHFRKARPWRG